MDENYPVKNEEEDNWDLIVSPKSSLLELNLREVWNYRDLILLFTKRDIISQYKQTILGPLWLIIQPILSTVFFTVIFGWFAKFKTGEIPYAIYTLSGLTIWNFFSTSLSKSSSVFLSNAGIFGKVYFPRLTVPISIVLSNAISFIIQFIVLLCLLFIYTYFKDFNWQPNIKLFFLLPFILIIFAFYGMGLGLIASALTTKYRDLSFLISFMLQFILYFSSVVFPLDGFAGKFQLLFNLNPLTHIVKLFRAIMISTEMPDPKWIIYSITIGIITLLLGILIFNKIEKSFMDTI
ncbi:MAG: ABC transporter permease [Sphingobacteriaceae bacterium]|nr:ABC transporter permease [Sphingobacteriaceae bacterium]